MTDDYGTVSQSFTVTVDAINDAPTLDALGNLTIEVSCFARGSLVLSVKVLLKPGHGLILAGQLVFKVDDSLAQNLVFVIGGIELSFGGITLSFGGITLSFGGITLSFGGIKLCLKFSVLFFDLVNFDIAGAEFFLELGAGSVVLLCFGEQGLQASDSTSIGTKFIILSFDLLGEFF